MTDSFYSKLIEFISLASDLRAMPPSKPNQVHAPRTLNAAYARMVLSHLQQTQPQSLHAFDAHQLSYLDQVDPVARCTLQDWHALMDAAERVSARRDLVPELAEQFKPWHAGLLGFTLMTASTLDELGGLLRRFHHLLNDVFTVERGVVGSRFYLRLHATSEEQSARLARLSLAIWAHRLRWLTAQPQLTLDASFTSPAADDMTPYRRIFGGDLRFAQSENTLWGDVALLRMPIQSRDPNSHQLVKNQMAQQYKQLLPDDDCFVARLKDLVRARLDTAQVTLDDVAAELKLTSRTLQRRLEEAGLNFRLMVDDVRKLQAQLYLRDTQMPLAEVASALGFSDHASFNRAFKRWTGSSPGTFRREQNQPPSNHGDG
jgi:AraC-like DNA-binding protein